MVTMRRCFRTSQLAVATCAVVALLAAPFCVSSAPADSSCFVSIVQLTDPPLPAYPDGGVSVRIYNGASRLFETPIKPLSRPVFTNRITFFTAKSMPVRLVVVVWPVVDEPADKGHGHKDASRGTSSFEDCPADEDLLGVGFEGLIADFDSVDEAAEAKKDSPVKPKERAAKPEKNLRSGGVVLCEAEIAWPPADGKHEIKCGESILLVRTEMIVSRSR